MAMKLYPDGAIQNIASAIRAKNGLSTTYKVSEMAQAITDLPSGGGGLELVTQEQRDTLTVVSGSYSNIGAYAFYRCSSLSSANFPECISIGNGAFQSCFSLTEANFPVCTSVTFHAFFDCSSLTSISFPKCTFIGAAAFQNCSSLTEANFPVCTSTGTYMFNYCFSLTSISFPVSTSIGTYAFGYCSSLTEVNFPVCTSIGSFAFLSCKSLSRLTLGTSNCTLSNSNAFNNTPMSNSTYLGYFGSIYVPSEYLSWYKTATNWSRYSARIVGY